MQTPQKCEACRATDRVCDLQRPVCGRCATHSLACVYPARPVAFDFVDQNAAAAFASRRAASRRAREASRRRGPIPLDVRVLQDTSPSASPDQGHLDLHLAPPILHELDDRVLQRFIGRWSSGVTCLGCLDSLPALLEISNRDSAMSKAILATAYADLAVLERHGDPGSKSHQAYFDTLQRLRHDLSDPLFAPSNEILAAVLAIDAFEVLYLNRTDPLGIHTSAILRLLELRRDDIMTQEQGYPLWRSAYQRIQVRQLFCGMQLTASMDMRGFSVEDDGRPEVRTIKFVTSVCGIMSKVQAERENSNDDSRLEAMLHLSARLRSLMQEAREWRDNNPSAPRPRRVDISVDLPFSQVFPRSTTLVYDNRRMASDRLLFETATIKVLDTLIELRTQMFSSERRGDDGVDQTRDFRQTAQSDLIALQATSRHSLDMVPFILGLVSPNGNPNSNPPMLNDTGVLTVKSPLRTIASLKYAPAEIREEANALLGFLDAHRHIIRQT